MNRLSFGSAPLCLGPLLAAIIFGGCSRPPQVAGEHRSLIASLNTAISAKRTEWLEASSTVIEQRHESGQMTDAEHAAFQAIVAKARSGDWEGAQSDVMQLGRAQPPATEKFDAKRTKH